MEKEKIIIIALIVVIAALLVGMAASMLPNMQKQDSKIKFKGNDTIKKGHSIKIKLTDSNGKEIADQTVNVTITDKDKASDYHSVETDENGVGTIKIDKDPGKYKVTVTYGGNDKYKASNATKTIKIDEEEEQVAESSSSSSSSSSSPSAYAYKSDGTPMYSQAEVSDYMYHKYGNVNYHIGDNGYVDMDQPGYDDAGHWVGYR
jgi:flagellar basal body-associated protein FliL